MFFNFLLPEYKQTLNIINHPLLNNTRNKLLNYFLWPLKSKSELPVLLWGLFFYLNAPVTVSLVSSYSYVLLSVIEKLKPEFLMSRFSYKHFLDMSNLDLTILILFTQKTSTVFNFLFFYPSASISTSTPTLVFLQQLLTKQYLFTLFSYNAANQVLLVPTTSNQMNHTSSVFQFLLAQVFVPNKFYKFLNKNLSYIFLKIQSKDLLFLSYFFKKSMFLLLKGLYDIVVVDYPSRNLRFELSYCFTSIYNKLRIFLKLFTSENLRLPSISNIYKSSNWLEREAWDLFGVFFTNHKNLRRILTDYGFKGFPFRKDFPLTGYIEVRFDDSVYAVVYEPLEVTQEFRVFNFKSPWESYVVA